MNVFTYRSIRRTTLIGLFLGALLVGIFSAYYGAAPRVYWIFFTVPLIPLLYKKKYAAIGACILLGLMLGVWRGSAVYGRLQHYKGLFGKNVVLTGAVSDDASYDEVHGVTEFHLRNLRTSQIKLPGRLQVSTREKAAIGRGDSLLISGKLKPSKGTSRQGTVSNAKIKILVKNNSLIEVVRARFFESIHNALPEPGASLGLGYLVGVRVNIPKELDDQLAIVGLTHIVAVSGYNLTIIVQAVRKLAGKRSAYQSVVFSGFLIVGFLIVAGGSAPITRAAVVCSISLLAWYFGRVVKPMLLLLLSGGITAFASPLYVWGDPGWYLSFLAFGGVLVLAPLIIERFFYKKPPGTTVQILLETLCAQLCTLPYTLFLFGGVSVIAPLANVLVLPLIPFIMLILFFVGLIGMATPVAAVWLGVVPGALLSFQIWLIKILSTVPGAHAEVRITAAEMLFGFMTIISCTVLLHVSVSKIKTRQRSGLKSDLL